jgi:hypothetical protein
VIDTRRVFLDATSFPGVDWCNDTLSVSYCGKSIHYLFFGRYYYCQVSHTLLGWASQTNGTDYDDYVDMYPNSTNVVIVDDGNIRG